MPGSYIIDAPWGDPTNELDRTILGIYPYNVTFRVNRDGTILVVEVFGRDTVAYKFEDFDQALVFSERLLVQVCELYEDIKAAYLQSPYVGVWVHGAPGLRQGFVITG